MAISRVWREAIAAAVGEDLATVEHVAKRLAYAELVPSGRGRHAPDYRTVDGARLLIGVLAEGVIGPATFTGKLVRLLGGARGDAIMIGATPEQSVPDPTQERNTALAGTGRAITVSPAGPFEGAVAGLLERLADPETARPVCAQVREVGVGLYHRTPAALIRVGCWLTINPSWTRVPIWGEPPGAHGYGFVWGDDAEEPDHRWNPMVFLRPERHRVSSIGIEALRRIAAATTAANSEGDRAS